MLLTQSGWGQFGHRTPSRFSWTPALTTKAEKFARTAHNGLAALRRQLSHAPPPAWAKSGNSRVFVAAMLAGSWSDSSNHDRQAVAALSGVPLAQSLAMLGARGEEVPIAAADYANVGSSRFWSVRIGIGELGHPCRITSRSSRRRLPIHFLRRCASRCTGTNQSAANFSATQAPTGSGSRLRHTPGSSGHSKCSNGRRTTSPPPLCCLRDLRRSSGSAGSPHRRRPPNRGRCTSSR